MYQCPICLKQYNESSFKKCECGFEDYNAFDSEEEILFKIFKYTKNVFLKRIDYPVSTLQLIYTSEGRNYVDIFSKQRGLEIVEDTEIENLTAINGIIAFQHSTKALILNCDYADDEFLDEAAPRILFIGKNFKGFTDEPKHMDRIKYLYVHKDNPYFEANNNRLIRK